MIDFFVTDNWVMSLAGLLVTGFFVGCGMRMYDEWRSLLVSFDKWLSRLLKGKKEEP